MEKPKNTNPKPGYYNYGNSKNKYQKISNQWYISNDVTDFKFQPIHDPTGNRAKELNKNAKVDPHPWIQNPKTIEGKLNARMGDPQGQSARASAFYARPGEDDVDNLRHADAAGRTQQAIAKATGSDLLGYFGSVGLGVGHELGTMFTDPRPWGVVTQEAYEDIKNNNLGAEMGYFHTPNATKRLNYLSQTYQMPDGYGAVKPFPGSNWTDPYDEIEREKAQQEVWNNPNPKPVGLTEKFADGGPLHDRDINGKLLQSTYASALGNMFREGGPFGEDQGVFDYATSIYASQPGNYYRTGGQFPRPYSLPEDSFKQGGTNLHNSVYASSSAPYPGIYAEGGPLLPPDNAPAGTPFNLANRNSWMGDYGMIPQGHNLSLPLTSLPGIGNQITSGAATANFKTVGDYVSAAENWERNQAGSPIAPGPVNINAVIPSTPPIPEVAKTNYYTDPYTGQVVKDFNPATGVATPREIPNSFGNTQYSSYLEKVANSPVAKENQQAINSERLSNMELLKTMTPEQKAAMRAAGLTPAQYLADPFSAGATKFAEGGSILSMSNTPQLEGEGKDLTYPDGAYVYGRGGVIKTSHLFADGGPKKTITTVPTQEEVMFQQASTKAIPYADKTIDLPEITVTPGGYKGPTNLDPVLANALLNTPQVQQKIALAKGKGPTAQGAKAIKSSKAAQDRAKWERIFDEQYYNQVQAKADWEKRSSGAAQPVDWFWTLPLAASSAGLNAAYGLGEALSGLMATELPGLAGTTVGQGLNAGFITKGILDAPSTVRAWQDVAAGKKDWKDAAEKTAWNLLDFTGAGETKAGLKLLGEDARAASNYLTTQTPLRNAYNYNPLANRTVPMNRLFHGTDNPNLLLDDIKFTDPNPNVGLRPGTFKQRAAASGDPLEMPGGFYTNDRCTWFYGK